MNNLLKQISNVGQQFGNYSLEEMRADAALENSGIHFISSKVVSEKGSKRLFMVICFFGEDLVMNVMQCKGLQDNGQRDDWSSISALDVLMDAARAGMSVVKFSGCSVLESLIVAVPCSKEIEQWESELGL